MAPSNSIARFVWNFRMVTNLFYSRVMYRTSAALTGRQRLLNHLCQRRIVFTDSYLNRTVSLSSQVEKWHTIQKYNLRNATVPIASQSKIPWFSSFLFAGGFLALLGFKTEEEEDELVQTIKLAVLSIQKGELDKAEQILHVALKMAQEKMEQQGITYIYDMLANIAYQKHEYKKAEKLFVETVRRLLAAGKLDTDNAIVEISIKLADIYSSLGEYKKAEDGFLFSIVTVQKKIDEKPNEMDKDLYLLLGMASEMYAHHLLENSRLQKSKSYYESALEISKKFNGPKHPQTLVLLNDLGGVCSLLHDYETATSYLMQAIELGKEAQSDDLPAFYCNMGAVYFKVGNLSLAGVMCKQAHLLATKLGNKIAEKDALACLDDIKKKGADSGKAEIPERLE